MIINKQATNALPQLDSHIQRYRTLTMARRGMDTIIGLPTHSVPEGEAETPETKPQFSNSPKWGRQILPG